MECTFATQCLTDKSLNQSISLDDSEAMHSDSVGSSSSLPVRLSICSMVSSDDVCQKKKKTKKVRFARRPKVNIFYKHDNTEGCLWFSKRDFRDTKKDLEEQGKQWRTKGYDILLKDVYKNGCREQLDIYVQLPGADYMRGAETWLCETLQQERTLARHRAVSTTIEKEIKLKSTLILSPEEIAQQLAVLYQELSRPAQDFAKRMGMADELGDKLGENPELPRFILPNRNPSKHQGMGRNSFTSAGVGMTSSIVYFVSTVAAAAMGA